MKADRVELPTTGGPGGERCDECRWWDDSPSRNARGELIADEGTGLVIGECRRFPPTIPFESSFSGDLNAKFPSTYPHIWCGEFKEKEDDTDDRTELARELLTMSAAELADMMDDLTAKQDRYAKAKKNLKFLINSAKRKEKSGEAAPDA